MHFTEAKLIISGLEENQEAELALLRYLKKHNSVARFIAHTGSDEDAEEMYREGAGFVLMPEYQTADYLAELIVEEQKGEKRFEEEREKEFKKLKTYKDKYFGA